MDENEHENESTSRELPDSEDLDDFDDDSLDGLIGAGVQRKSPFHFHYIKGGPNDGKLGMVTPKTRHVIGTSPEARANRQKIADEWEAKAILMHENQQPLAPPAEKPSEIVPKYSDVTTQRGD